MKATLLNYARGWLIGLNKLHVYSLIHSPVFCNVSFSEDHVGSSGALFLIGPAICGRWITPANNSGEHDDRQKVWQSGEEIVVKAWVRLLDASQEGAQVPRGWGKADRDPDGLRPHKEEGAAERPQRRPAPEDHGG
jgi:hypothetical protein